MNKQKYKRNINKKHEHTNENISTREAQENQIKHTTQHQDKGTERSMTHNKHIRPHEGHMQHQHTQEPMTMQESHTLRAIYEWSPKQTTKNRNGGTLISNQIRTTISRYNTTLTTLTDDDLTHTTAHRPAL